MPVGQIEVSPVSFEDSRFFRKPFFFVVSPAYFFEDPSFAQVRPEHGVFVFVLDRNEFIQESEEFFDLLFRKVGVILCVFDFEGVYLRVFSGYYVWQRAEAWIAYRNTYGVIPVFLQKFHEGVFGVEASLSPSANGVFVNLLHW